MASSCLASKYDTKQRKRVRWKPNRRMAPAFAALLLLAAMLVACGPAGSTPSGSTTSSTATTLPGQTSSTATLAGGTATPTTSPTPFSGAFQVVFTDSYTATACSGGQPTGTICVSTSGSGQAAGLGTTSLSRTSIYAPGGADSCDSASTKGTLTLATGDTVAFSGTGTFCPAFQSANFTYKVTGGTGSYLHATGSGTIQAPRPTSSSTGTETWTGTLQQ
jgi:hypothetical protein